MLANDRYVYQHPSVMEAITLDFGQRYPSDILDSCSVHFLLQRVFTKKSAPRDNEYVVILEPVMFPQLSVRLVKEMIQCISDQKDGIRSMSCSVDHVRMKTLTSYEVFKDDVFNQVFLRHLKNKALFHLLFTSSSPHSQQFTFLFFAAASGQDALVHDVISSYLCDVQQLPRFGDHVDHVLYAACYSGSQTAVRALLMIGAQADYMTAHDIDDMRAGWWVGPGTCTTLMHAAYSGNVDVLRLVLDRLQQQQLDVPKHVGIEDGKDRTALLWWAQGELTAADALQILLKAGADVHARDDVGQTALHSIVQSGDKAAVRSKRQRGG